MTDAFENLAAAPLRGLAAYDPGHDLEALRARHAARGLVELGSNENPWGPSPAALAAAREALAGLHRYPDPRGSALRQALAARHRVAADAIVLGNGSHELLMLAAQVFAGPGDEVVVSRYGFAVHALAARAVGARVVTVDALPEQGPAPFGHDLEAMAAALGPRTRMVYVCNPNNPTGTWFPPARLEALLERLPESCVLVVDEAYAEYLDAAASVLDAFAGHPRLVVTRTFSKAYGLAGARVGYAIAHPGLAGLFERLRESFNVSLPALAAATAAVGDPGYVEDVRARNATERAFLAAGLRARGMTVVDSRTNFLLCRLGVHCARIEAGLLERGVVVRPMAGYGLPQHVRISIGRREENAALLDALDRVLESLPC
ncbi:MAG: histidinol-phosphate aminotransferase 2 [Lysobacteraceae bacterium]|nr:MAG: histidinol-phosphate aminotransferase 2 [Xanthomonadaceae bacterium]